MNRCSIIANKEVVFIFPLDYTFGHDGLLYKHTVTDAPPCDAYSMHTHNLYEVLYFISGDATHVIEDRKYKLKKGDLILIRPSKYHFIQIDSSVRYERYDILFSDRHVEQMGGIAVPQDIEVINLPSGSVADGIFKRMDYYSENLDEKGFYDVLRLLIGELFFCISINVKNEAGADFSVISPLLSKALSYINDNLFSIKNISDVAAALFVSESYLFRLFKNELKQSPKRYILNKRLLAAQNLLAAGEGASKVYEKCGFGDYTAFYRSYKSLFGYAPSEEKKGPRP